MAQDMNVSCDLIKVESRADINTVANMAKEIWFEFYVPIIGEEQVRYMTENLQSVDAIQNQIDTERFQYYFISVDEERIGYIALLFDAGKCFLSKFYMVKKTRGNGYGKKAIKQIELLCQKENASHIWLTVNRDNPTLQIYDRLGFVNRGVQQKDIGAGFVMDDFLMEKRVETN